MINCDRVVHLAYPTEIHGVADTNNDPLSPYQYPFLATRRRCKLNLDGTGGVLDSNRAEVLRCNLESSEHSSFARAHRVTLLGQLEGRFQIPGLIPT